MSEETKEYPFEKTFDVKFDESSLKTFNDLIKEKGVRHFKLESDLYGVLDVVSYEEYEKLQQKVEQLEKEKDRLNNIISEFENKGYDIAQERANFLLEIERLNNIINKLEKWLDKKGK